jgi:hypothetical protein
MKLINRTPEHLRCAYGTCPGVWELEDGRLLIVGKRATLDEHTKDMLGPYVGKISLQWDEQAIIIDRALLGDLVQSSSQQEITATCPHHTRDRLKRIDGSEMCQVCGMELFGPYVTVPEEESPVQTSSQQVETSSGHLGSGNSFCPDWELTIGETLAVALTISLAKHIPNWPGATDEQFASVAADLQEAYSPRAAAAHLIRKAVFAGDLRRARQVWQDHMPQQGQALSGHLDFKARAREIVNAHAYGMIGEDFLTRDLRGFIAAIATALREAHEKGLVQSDRSPATELSGHPVAAARRLDRALCNFCNGASDSWSPTEWRDETKRNFTELCAAYNEAHASGLLTLSQQAGAAVTAPKSQEGFEPKIFPKASSPVDGH